MLNINNSQRHANQNHNEILPHTCKNGYYQRQEITDIGDDVEKREPLCTFGGNLNWCSHYGKQYEDSSIKVKNRSSNYTSGYVANENEKN